jgi:hypothetical protein
MKRMNLLCALLLASVMLSFVTNLFVGPTLWPAASWPVGTRRMQRLTTKEWFYSSCELKPKVSHYLFKTVSKRNGGVIAFNPTAIDYHVVEVKDAYGAITNFCRHDHRGVYGRSFLVSVVGVLQTDTRHQSRRNLHQRHRAGFRHMAVAILLFYACEWIFAISRYLNEAHILQMKDFMKWP